MAPLVVVAPPARPFVPFRSRAWRAAAAVAPPADEALANVYQRCGFVRTLCHNGLWTVTIDERALAAAMSRATLRFVPFPFAAGNRLMRERLRVDPLHEARVLCGHNIAAINVYTPPLWLLLRVATGSGDQYDVTVPAHYLFFMYHSIFLSLAAVDFEPPLADAPPVPAWAEGEATDAAFELFCAAADRDAVEFHLQHCLTTHRHMLTAEPGPPLPPDAVRANLDRVVGYSTAAVPLDELCDAFPPFRHWTPTDADVDAVLERERIERRFAHYAATHGSDATAVELEPAVVAERMSAIADAPLTPDQAVALYQHYGNIVAEAPTAADLAALDETLPPRRGPITAAVRAIAREQFAARRDEVRTQIKMTHDYIEKTRERSAQKQKAWTAQFERLQREIDSLAHAQLEQSRARWRTDDARLSDLAFSTVQTINNLEMALMCVLNVPLDMRRCMQTLPVEPRAEHTAADTVAACDDYATKLMAAIASQTADTDRLFPAAFPRELLGGQGTAGFNEVLMHRLRHWDSFIPHPAV